MRSRVSRARPSGARFATLRRAIRLFGAFRVEQSDPDHFYGMLAEDSVRQIAEFADPASALVLDVGGGPGYFAAAFRAAGAAYFAVDADLGELSMRSTPGPDTVIGSGTALPVRTGVVDICFSSNVLEHVEEAEAMADEMLRVTRPGGLVFLSYTLWLSPWGGHETAPWHYLGGHFAARRFRRKNGRAPKNDFGRTMFALSAGRMLRWSRTQQDGEVVAAFPRYHPWWAWWMVRLPGLREVLSWNLVIVLRRR